MAGGKETPRQKLIGMMYLVLLALLALQVSSSIILKFQFLNDSIMLSNNKMQNGNEEAVRSIAQAVEENKFTPEDVAVLNDSKEIRTQTKTVLDYLAAIKKELIQASGGDKDADGNYPGAKDEESIAQVMLGANPAKAKGLEVKTKINGFVDMLNKTATNQKLKKAFTYLALDGNEDPIFKNDPEQRNKNFAQLNFENTPLVAALAILSEKESQVLAMEAELLGLLANKVGAVKLPVDKLRPVISTNSSYVVAGMEYQAEMFMAAYSSTFQPKMTYGGHGLNVSSDGVGSVKFRAGASNFDANGLSKQSWRGTIAFPKSNGQDSIYSISQDYYVVKPVIQVQSAAVQALYRNCGNELNIAVPALGAQFNPEYSITGGTLTKNGNGKIMIVPTDRTVKIVVRNKGVPIGTLDYRAKAVPFANFEINLDMKTGVTANRLAHVICKARGPKDFEELMPKECKYELLEIKVYLTRSGKLLEQTTIKGGAAVNLTTIKARALPGDVVVFEAVRATRKNYLGQIEDAKINNPIISISIK